ncbi:hypothetical protein E2C01_078319 [Portunus trituberculatus]|uniref:Uncharacterized protein n=1 Tax=Portunus trituberculatus TaxID=210409 RepID=A0A5B7IPX1_PORTR|nr:hypothetical protein [Portunus trituberculatus]
MGIAAGGEKVDFLQGHGRRPFPVVGVCSPPDMIESVHHSSAQTYSEVHLAQPSPSQPLPLLPTPQSRPQMYS